MTSKFKDPTESIPPSSSAESTEVPAQPSLPLASSDNTPHSTPIMKQPSPGTSQGDNSVSPTLTTVPTTVKITEKSRQHATLVKVALRQLETAGLIRRFKVLSADGQHPTKMRIEFDLTLWTEELDLK